MFFRFPIKSVALALAATVPLAGCEPSPRGTGQATKPKSPFTEAPPDQAQVDAPHQELKPRHNPRPVRAPRPCHSFAAPKQIGTVDSPDLNELSGLVFSPKSSVYFTHNDSEDAARVYVLSTSGEKVGALNLPSSFQSVDAEDIALLPGGAKPDTLYFADIGDNLAQRSSVQVARFSVPTKLHGTTPITDFELMRLTYEDGPHNAETLLVDPASGEMLVVSKSLLGWSDVYSAGPFKEEGRLVRKLSLAPEFIGETIHVVTGGDVSADGKWIALRTYGEAFLFERLPGESLLDALAVRPCPVTTSAEPQGEAIAFVGPGSPPSLVTVSEGNKPGLFRVSPE